MPVLNCEMFEKYPMAVGNTEVFGNGISKTPSCGQNSHITHLQVEEARDPPYLFQIDLATRRTMGVNFP